MIIWLKPNHNHKNVQIMDVTFCHNVTSCASIIQLIPHIFNFFWFESVLYFEVFECFHFKLNDFLEKFENF
jgi:hypothetical protein